MSDYWKEIIGYYASSLELKTWLESDEGLTLETISEEFTEIIVNAFGYQGFNPLKIMTLIHKNYTRSMQTGSRLEYKIKYQTEGVDNEFKYSNKESLTRDIQLIVLVFAQRGSVWKKISLKSNDGVNDIMEMLKEKLGFDEDLHDAGTALGPDVITIPRLIGCFPTLLCNAYHLGAGKLIFAISEVGLDPSLSRALATSHFAACIPPTWIDLQLNAHLYFFLVCIKIDDVLHKKEQKYTTLEQMLAYYKATYNSPAFPIRSRANFCKSIKVSNTAGTKFNTKLTPAIVEAEARIRALRPSDPYLEDVIAQLKALQ